MLKAHLASGSIVLGIDAENIKRLLEDMPIFVNLKQLKGTDSLLLLAGYTLTDIMEKLKVYLDFDNAIPAAFKNGELIVILLDDGTYIIGIDGGRIQSMLAGQCIYIDLRLYNGNDSIVLMAGETMDDLKNRLENLTNSELPAEISMETIKRKMH